MLYLSSVIMQVSVASVITGHGSDEHGCGEFCVTSHHIKINSYTNNITFDTAGRTWEVYKFEVIYIEWSALSFMLSPGILLCLVHQIVSFCMLYSHTFVILVIVPHLSWMDILLLDVHTVLLFFFLGEIICHY